MTEEKKTIFAVSDIHGYYDLFREALEESGFDPGDPTHLLVCCGDLFDRGEQNKQVWSFLESLPHKVLIRGNHEDLLEEAFDRGLVSWVDMHNGTDVTVQQLLGEKAFDRVGRIDTRRHAATIASVRRFFSTMVDYFETENYIFTHGWIPMFDDAAHIIWNADWRRADIRQWRDARFTAWTEAYARKIKVEKTLVCGHRTVSHANRFDPTRPPNCSLPFYGDGVIAIDALTCRSGRVNVIRLEDRVLSTQVHTMGLMPQMFEKMAAGEKCVELRLFDEKRQTLRVGDHILFSSTADPTRQLLTRVLGLHRYPAFEAYLEEEGVLAAGFAPDEEEEALALLHALYGGRDAQTGALVIRLCLL